MTPHILKQDLFRQNFESHFTAGLILSMLSSLFIGSSFVIKKIALKKLNTVGYVRASAGGYGYLKQWLWWIGLLTMGVGEGANLLAYAFAPAALVTPLGALSIIVAAALSSKFLNEKLNIIGKVGCMLCIIGSVIFVIHSPKSEEVKSFTDLVVKMSDNFFIVYVVSILIMILIVKTVFVPRFGNSNIVVYLLMCSAIGSLTVVLCKAVALGVKDMLSTNFDIFSEYIFWLLLTTSVICIVIQMNYLNKSLDIFNTNIVTPVYYVMFTILVIIASGILFREWEQISAKDMIGCLCGFLIVTLGIFMLNIFRDIKISVSDLNFNTKFKRAVNQNASNKDTFKLMT